MDEKVKRIKAVMLSLLLAAGVLVWMVAPSAGVGYVWDATSSITVIGEFFAGFERFQDADSDIRLSGGVNWKVPNLFTVRAALVLGLSDGAPDHRLIAGVSFDY